MQMVRDKLIEFVKETARHITSNADVSPEVQQLRYCLCAVARQVGIHLGNTLPQAFPVLVSCSLQPDIAGSLLRPGIEVLHVRPPFGDLSHYLRATVLAGSNRHHAAALDD